MKSTESLSEALDVLIDEYGLARVKGVLEVLKQVDEYGLVKITGGLKQRELNEKQEI